MIASFPAQLLTTLAQTNASIASPRLRVTPAPAIKHARACLAFAVRCYAARGRVFAANVNRPRTYKEKIAKFLRRDQPMRMRMCSSASCGLCSTHTHGGVWGAAVAACALASGGSVGSLVGAELGDFVQFEASKRALTIPMGFYLFDPTFVYRAGGLQ